ncbi:hypothetical protein ZONE111904_04235 [Zobellia nedashkovskayae]
MNLPSPILNVSDREAPFSSQKKNRKYLTFAKYNKKQVCSLKYKSKTRPNPVFHLTNRGINFAHAALNNTFESTI